MIEDLKRLLVVLQENSVTRAAEKLHITQPGLSHSIQRVEKSLGIKLFRHDGKKLILTEQGKQRIIVIERIVELWSMMQDKDIYLEERKHTIGVFDNAALILAPLFKTYSDNKNFTFELIIDTSEKLFSQLQAGILDLCICLYDKQKPHGSNISLLYTYEESLIPVSSLDRSESEKNIPFILYNRGSVTRKYIDQTFIRNGLQPNVVTESTSPIFMKALASLGMGVALLPENFVRQEVQNKVLKKVDLSITWQRTIGIYTTKESRISQDDSIFKEILALLDK